jgi:hypothetical protein
MTRLPARVKRESKNRWVAICGARRCKFSEEHSTHNGAHIVKARHNRREHAGVAS